MALRAHAIKSAQKLGRKYNWDKNAVLGPHSQFFDEAREARKLYPNNFDTLEDAENYLHDIIVSEFHKRLLAPPPHMDIRAPSAHGGKKSRKPRHRVRSRKLNKYAKYRVYNFN